MARPMTIPMTRQASPPAQPTHQPGAPWAILEAAAHLGISERHLRRLIDTGKVKSIQFGRLVKISDDEMKRIAREGTGSAD